MPIVGWLIRAALVSGGLILMAPVFAAETPHEVEGVAKATSLSWSAPGDDSLFGQAVGYDIRFSRDPITSANFAQATRLNTMLLPGPPRTPQTFSFTGLTPGVTYHFAVKTVDERGNWSKISNIATIVAGTVGLGDAAIAEPHFSNPWPNPARVGTRFTVSLARAQSLQIDAYDVTGRLVKTLATGIHSAGTFDLTWDLRDREGRALKAGVYLVRAQVGERVFLRRLTTVR